MKKAIIIIIIFISAISYIKAQAPALFDSPAEAFELGDTTNAPLQCQDDQLCGDGNFTDRIDIWTAVRDGSTSTAGDVKNATSDQQDTVIKMIFDIDGLADGNYTWRHFSSTGEHTISLYPYTTHYEINTSHQQTYYIEESEQWHDIDITDIVRQSFNEIGRVEFRIMGHDPNLIIKIEESYLRQPITVATVDFLAQGVEISTLERWTENSWKIIADVDLGIENVTCLIERVDENHTYVMPVLAMEFIDNTNQIFGMTWYTNETQIEETYSYRVNCDVTIEGITFEDIYQYTYISREKGFWEAFQGLWAYIIGFMTDILISIEGSVNETLNITKEINRTTKETNQTTHQIDETTLKNQEILINITSQPHFDLISR